VTAKKNLIEKS